MCYRLIASFCTIHFKVCRHCPFCQSDALLWVLQSHCESSAVVRFAMSLAFPSSHLFYAVTSCTAFGSTVHIRRFSVPFYFSFLKGKVKQSCPCTRHEDVWWSRSTAPFILNVGAARGVVSFTPWPAYWRGNNSRYSLHRTLGGLQTWSERFGEDVNFSPLPGIEPRFLKSQVT